MVGAEAESEGGAGVEAAKGIVVAAAGVVVIVAVAAAAEVGVDIDGVAEAEDAVDAEIHNRIGQQDHVTRMQKGEHSLTTVNSSEATMK